MPCRLNVNAYEFILTDAHATNVAAEMLNAVRDGGGYVHIDPLSGREADVLITPATAIRFERITVIQPSPADQDEPPFDDMTWVDDFT